MPTTPPPQPSQDTGPIRQVKKSVSLSRRNHRAILLAMAVHEEQSFSHAVDTVITEAMAAGVPYFKGEKR